MHINMSFKKHFKTKICLILFKSMFPRGFVSCAPLRKKSERGFSKEMVSKFTIFPRNNLIAYT